VVAIPARDEEGSIVACLASVDRAAEHCPLPVRVAVAADRCQDRTAELAAGFDARHCAVVVVAGRWRTVGEARAAAVTAATSGESGRAWIANTDADCRVPEDWLDRQVASAARGLHAVAGTVRLDRTQAPAELWERFGAHYAAAGRRRRHLHAANFGVHAAAYCRVGGWSSGSALGEEHHLWRRLRDGRCRLLHDDELWVYTSHRRDGRAPGGFASTLGRLQGV
jgi:hypothetical protein